MRRIVDRDDYARVSRAGCCISTEIWRGWIDSGVHFDIRSMVLTTEEKSSSRPAADCRASSAALTCAAATVAGIAAGQVLAAATVKPEALDKNPQREGAGGGLFVEVSRVEFLRRGPDPRASRSSDETL